MTPPPSSFTFTVEVSRSTAHLHLAGDLDYDTGDTLVQEADRCLTDHPHLRELRLDCAHLCFCDSVGISSLLTIHRRTTARTVRLRLENSPPFLQRLLDVTGIQQLFAQPQTSQQAE
ncbi:STAS domain-containing protein [Streptomyces fulvorobeus]|uniref:Anti-sigma factor antagonist n=1 Tax=Streptomyces fulvorobeus TaxID=284028 RepID=A0A7J0C2Z6_9ACTN|nr:STAS domain-containing protein [Streptomyces fulvorobeus]NYE40605.1 anti-anti-sigma factor [Streptomyces fulvorobeus]GFM96899.1 anti-sigma factor antagonist [Streptomyces fulvorobeus]